MRQLLNTLFVTSEDIYLSLDGENVVVNRGGEAVARYPLHTLQSIVSFSYAGASPALMGACAQRDIGLAFCSPRGKFLTRVAGQAQGNVLLRRMQYRVADDPSQSCRVAGMMIFGKVFNARWSVEHTRRDHAMRIDESHFSAVSGQLQGLLLQIAAETSLDSLRGLPETVQYGQGTQRLAQMNAQTDALAQDAARLKRISGRNAAAANTVILLFDLAMLFIAAALCRTGRVGFDGVLIPTLALFSSFGPVVALANLGSTLQSTFAAGNRVLDILDETPAVAEVTGRPDIAFTGADAQHVTFSYGGETVLSDVSVTVPEHAIVGIVGRSGSGKSTLLKLLMRFWVVQQGSVHISDTDISAVNTANLRALESFVTQDTHLFYDSIRSNLRIARPDATDAEIEAACRKAAVHDFICTLPQGYDAPVGELGDTLSGGERQRLGLARAFLHDAPFLLLDEPTSNLDSLNEAVILRALREERAGRTVVLVSHRASTMRIADTVYSVENGRMS